MNTEVSDRERWNGRYADGEEGGTPLMLGRNLHLFPRSGLALDVAGGPGQAAVILAARGLDVTVCDVSDVALRMAAERAERSKVSITTIETDLTSDPLPNGPWDLITCFNYLDRKLFPAMIEQLAPHGQLAVTLVTRSNLERNEHPTERFLLDDGELPSLLGDLAIEYYDEGWKLDGRHCAEALARRV
ncbi:MAG: class I SAM-dependent methyltransferase [Acidimicrobiia bacterium]|nr:class I SAM-dependent methyltransferase [Acidimicrobiia bacterium]